MYWFAWTANFWPLLRDNETMIAVNGTEHVGYVFQQVKMRIA